MKASFLIIILILTTLFAQTGNAQILGGVFSQKETDLKLVGQQIALLQVYVGVLEKEYNLAKEGLTAIGDIKKGDLDLHTNYFGSLKIVNPAIERSTLVATVLERERRLLQYCRRAKSQPGLSTTEIDYLFPLTANLIDAATATLTGLADLLTDGRLTLTDDERMERLQNIDRESSQQLRFAIQMNNDVAVITKSQQQEQNTLDLLQRLNP